MSLKIQSGVAAAPEQKNETFFVQFREPFTNTPAVSLTLQSGTFDGTFGKPPFIVKVDSTEMEINPNNYGCVISWIAVES